jgi:hypothetical protein
MTIIEIHTPEYSKKVAKLNDAFRTSGAMFYITSGVSALPLETQANALAAVRSFTAFTPENNPYEERDMVFVEVDGQKFIFTISYYDIDMRFLSDDPSDAKVTKRVGTLLLAEEY